MNTPLPETPSAAADAKRLLRLSRTASLATLDEGAPLATLIGVASDWDGSPLFLLSELSRHTRNIGADDRVSLMLVSESRKGDPLNKPRLSLNGRVTRCEDGLARGRYLRRNPKARLYIDFADFSLRRLQIVTVHFNGGFGRAGKLAAADLLTPPMNFAALAAAEDDLLAEVTALGAERLSRIVGGAPLRRSWRAIGIDGEGFDLSAGAFAGRVDFAAPAPDPAAWIAELGRRAAA